MVQFNRHLFLAISIVMSEPTKGVVVYGPQQVETVTLSVSHGLPLNNFMAVEKVAVRWTEKNLSGESFLEPTYWNGFQS